MKQRATLAAISALFLTCVCTLPISAIVPSLFRLTGWAACPTGTTIDVENRPLAQRSGYKVVVSCLGEDGRAVEANHTLGLIALFGMAFLAFFILCLIIPLLNSLRPAKAVEPPPDLATPLRPAQEYQIQQLIRKGKQLEAIRQLRDITGLDLAQAKARIDHMQAQLPPTDAAPESAPQTRPAAPAAQDADGGLKAKLQELKELLDADLITPADYESKKQELLARM